MSKMKKLLAMVLALAMVLGMSITTFAATPVATDSADVTVQNVEVGSTLKAYQIIDATYTTEGFVSYVWAPGTPQAGQTVAFDENEDVVGLTDEVIAALAANTAVLGTPVTVVADASPETMNLTVGTWMILVSPKADATKIYNPMIASVYYNVTASGDDNTATGTTVDANDTWELATTNAYAKSTTISIEKSVDDKEFEVNDIANYTVTTTIPSYSDEYTDVTFKIKDTIVNGLEYTEDPVVKVNGETLTDGEEYELSYGEGNKSFTIDFDNDYIFGLADKSAEERAVVVTYPAKVTSEAINVVGENKVELIYTHKPGTETDTKEDTVKVYTFEFDGVLKKVKEDKTTALSGATFTLYRTSVAEENAIATYTTIEGGNIYFAGLDSDEVYYLKETVAPDGYSLNEKAYKIKVVPTYGNDGELVSYVVEVDDKASGTIIYGAKPETNLDVVVNTKLVALPGTGGIGTTMFTIGGCGIMIAAAYLFFASRRREEA